MLPSAVNIRSAAYSTYPLWWQAATDDAGIESP